MNRANAAHILFVFLCVAAIQCEAKTETLSPPAIGNFAMPSSQEPGSLVGFGQNVLDKGEWQVGLSANDVAGVNEHFSDVIPAYYYGITDQLTTYLALPIAPSNQSGGGHSAGLEDAIAQLEYAFLSSSTATHTDQMSLVANISLPTGSIDKDPPTGMGAPSFFIGTTYNRMYVDWYWFAAPGVRLPTAKNGTKFGNSYFYQFGFGRNIANVNQWLFAWLIETDGIYSQRNRIKGVIDSSSGGNVIYVTPSIWASTKQLILQLGVGGAAVQHLLGNQPSYTYLIVGNVTWSVY